MSKSITIDGVEYVPASEAPAPSPVKIVVLQRGWVVIGRHATLEDGTVRLTSAHVIRVWGTTKGLGELVNGPTGETVLDHAGTVTYHPLTAVLTIDAKEDAWDSLL